MADNPNIPMVNITAQDAVLRPLVQPRLERVMESGRYINGPEVAELEAALAEFTGAHHAVACSSGTDALLMLLMAHGVGPGDAVFVPAFTFAATAGAVALAGATPVFVDIDAATMNMSADSLSAAIAATAKTAQATPRAVIAVDLFGHLADYEALGQLCDRHELLLLEDAAQSMGASRSRRMAGGLGVDAATSFFPAKPLGCWGDGGMVFTSNSDTADLLRSIREHGQGGDRYRNLRVGLNARMDTMQAAVLLGRLPLFEQELNRRRELAERYGQLLAAAAEASPHPAITLPTTAAGSLPAWAQYTLRVADQRRDQLRAALAEQGIASGVYYPEPLSKQPAFADNSAGPVTLTTTEQACSEVLSLPISAYLGDDEQARVAEAVVTVLLGTPAGRP